MGYRGGLKSSYNRIAELLPPPRPDRETFNQLLIRGNCESRLTRTDVMLTGYAVIKHFGGVPPDHVNYPKKDDPSRIRCDKGKKNAIRTHNEDLACERIRGLLLATGRFNIPDTTSRQNLLQIGALNIRCFRLDDGNRVC